MPLDLNLWRINDATFASLGIESPRLRIGNMLDGTFTFSDPSARFDANPLFATDAPVALFRGDVCKFRGIIDLVPRFLGDQAESITYRAIGPWGWLREYPFLQAYKYAVHPSIPSPELISFSHTRAVLGQADDGGKLTLGQVVTKILQGAITAGCPISIGAITGFDGVGVWDEVTDLSCAEAIQRTLLNMAPDAVVSWDFSGDTPAFVLDRRGSMPEATLDVPPPGDGGTGTYAPFEEIDLTPLPKDVVDTVVVFFRSTDTSGSRPYEVLGYDVAGDSAIVGTIPALAAARQALLAPASAKQTDANTARVLSYADPDDEGLAAAADAAAEAAAEAWSSYQHAREAEMAAVTAAASSRRALVRTIDLAGARSTTTNIEQPVEVRPFYSRLLFNPPPHAAPNTGNLLPGDADFLRVAAFWKRRSEWLSQPGVTPIAFRNPRRREQNSAEGVFNPACAFELVDGDIADWMVDHMGIVHEVQIFEVDVAATSPIPGLGTPGSPVLNTGWQTITTTVRATNAQTHVYAYNTSWSFDAAETPPENVAAQLWEAHKLLHYEGTITLVEEEAALDMMPGLALNLNCAVRPEWLTMRSLFQVLDCDLAAGRSRLDLGPPKQLNLGGTRETMFTNRTKRDVVSAAARATGVAFQ